MNRFRFVATGVALVALLATSVASAQGPRGGGRGGRGFGPGAPGFVLNELNLTDAQREQVREIRERYREQSQTLSRRLGELAAKEREAIETIPVNETLITSATQDMTQTQVDVAIQEARDDPVIWAVQTPEQQATATKLRAERQAQMEQRRQERRTQ